MTKSELEESLSGIGTLLMLWDDADAVGFEAILGLVAEIVSKPEETDPRIVSCDAWIMAESKTRPTAELVNPLNDFITAATTVLSGGQAKSFPHEGSAAPATGKNGVELGPNYDQDFVAEFIERHSLAMDELEGEVANYRFKSQPSSEERDEFAQYVKKYLHNVKGDAGSIGLVGIEKATHALEDLIANKGVGSVLNEILAYREWVKTCVDTLTGKRQGAEPSSIIITQFRSASAEETVKAEHTPPPPQAAAAQTAATIAQPQQATTQHNHPAKAATRYRITADSEIFSEFTAEALDHLGNIEELLLNNPSSLSPTDMDTVFRCVHSLKGASGYFNLEEINLTSHHLENLLDEVRNGKRILDPVLQSLVFRYIDLQKELLDRSRDAAKGNGELEWSADSLQYIEEIVAYAEGRTVSVAAPKQPAEKESDPVAPVSTTTAAPPATASTILSAQAQTPSVSETLTPMEVKTAPPIAPPKESSADSINVKTFVKVDTARLDLLIDSIGEMVIYSSMLIRKCRELLGDHESVIKTTHQVEKFSRGLQDIGMSMRLDPVKSLFQKMSRLVWDVSKKLGKEVDFVMQGEDTELDRTVIEKLADPLMHMVRNALDHGLEPPDERAANGKPRAGTVKLSAAHVGGSIHIEIQDDGRGLDAEKLTKKAIEKGILPPGTLLPKEEAFRLIFAPGFSTAAAITDISGRGVGMDVVRNNIENMRGTIRIDSELGKGATFRIELPLTLAIMDGIETIVGPERFIIPTLAVLEFMKPEPKMITRTVGRGEMFYFRGNYLPLFRLDDLFGVEREKNGEQDGLVIVIESGNEQVALMVDGMVGTCQTVIKGLGKMFDEARGFAGCAIMPNGNIGLILDVRSLIQLARAEYSGGTVDSISYERIRNEGELSLH